MFGNAILPPLTFNSNEEQTGQGASLCNKQTPVRGRTEDGEECTEVFKQCHCQKGGDPKPEREGTSVWTAFFPLRLG